MNLLGKVSLTTLLILTIIACSVFTPKGETSSSGKVIASDMVIINTNNPNYGIVLSHKNGEALLLATEAGNDGTVTNVKSVTWISPEKKSITVYFDNGLPTHAVAEGNLVIFRYNSDSTVNVTTIAPDGTQSNQPNVPIDLQKIPDIQTTSMQDGRVPHLAMIAMRPTEMTSKEWGRFASIAFGVFSCTATIASGGTLSIVFGIGCAATIYTIWATSQGEESPVLDSSATGVSIGQCAIGIAQKDPISAADCASAIIDIGSKLTETSDDVVLHNQAVIPTRVLSSQTEPVLPNANLQQPSGCTQLNLTPEECANVGAHEYSWTNTVYTAHNGAVVDKYDPVSLTIIFGEDSVSFGGNDVWAKIAPNSYTSEDEDFSNILTFYASGFSIDAKVHDDYKCSNRAPGEIRSCSWDQLMEYTIIK